MLVHVVDKLVHEGLVLLADIVREVVVAVGGESEVDEVALVLLSVHFACKVALQFGVLLLDEWVL